MSKMLMIDLGEVVLYIYIFCYNPSITLDQSFKPLLGLYTFLTGFGRYLTFASVRQVLTFASVRQVLNIRLSEAGT